MSLLPFFLILTLLEMTKREHTCKDSLTVLGSRLSYCTEEVIMGGVTQTFILGVITKGQPLYCSRLTKAGGVEASQVRVGIAQDDTKMTLLPSSSILT